jgi:hypothetical protein
MAATPSVSSEIREQQAEARDALSTAVKGAVDDFMESLTNIAQKHKWCMHFQMGMVAALCIDG